MIRYLTAGESHGPALVGILEGMPAGLAISEDEIAVDLARRQKGYGRGARMQIEHDRARLLAGVRYGETLGSPIALLLENKDWVNWQTKMRQDSPPESERAEPLTTPRPGHADYAGAVKYRQRDVRNVIERASARESSMRVALGAIGRKFFGEFGIRAGSHVLSIGGIHAEKHAEKLDPAELNRLADQSPIRCLSAAAEKEIIAAIDEAKFRGDTLGGTFEVTITGLPIGVGSCMHPDRRLDSILAAAVMSIPAVKSVHIGLGDSLADRPGSEIHDRMLPSANGIKRDTNFAGGIEGGMSNGETIVIRAAMKPLAGLGQPLETVDLKTNEAAVALTERSDVCAVPAASVIGEAVCLLALMNPFLEKFGGDSVSEIAHHLSFKSGSPWL
jgi:chorismate synthase